MSSKKKGLVIGVLVLALLAAGFWLLYARMAQPPVAGAKHVALTVVHLDGSQKAFGVDTDKEYLGEALVQEGLVEGEQGPYGLYIKTVDGETADDAKQEWWCLTKGGQEHMNSVDSTVIQDGDAYELTLKTGY